MSVSPNATAQAIYKRISHRQNENKISQKQALQIATKIAIKLKDEWGAKEVWLHGSLSKQYFSSNSDIDLAISGLNTTQLNEAAIALDEMAKPFILDFCSIERLNLNWQARIKTKGLRLI
ncbi:MAG: nucleotidyltransferase domain-containing protein [Deltaproteobacteria bacterium]|nr:nucleotidyltransferase domain-containing protein [Deltaproteobacteria bacterium]